MRETGPILSNELMRDMLSLSIEEGKQVENFILRLAENPFSPELLADSVDNKDGSYYHRLPFGCCVFWELLINAEHPRFGSLEGVTVRVTGAAFDTSAR